MVSAEFGLYIRRFRGHLPPMSSVLDCAGRSRLIFFNPVVPSGNANVKFLTWIEGSIFPTAILMAEQMSIGRLRIVKIFQIYPPLSPATARLSERARLPSDRPGTARCARETSRSRCRCSARHARPRSFQPWRPTKRTRGGRDRLHRSRARRPKAKPR